MSQANIPNITPTISITVGQSISLILASIALEELALAHVINSEAEKIQFVLGTLDTDVAPPPVTLSSLLLLNNSVKQTLQSAIKQEMLLQFKLENVLDFIRIIPTGSVFEVEQEESVSEIENEESISEVEQEESVSEIENEKSISEVENEERQE